MDRKAYPGNHPGMQEVGLKDLREQFVRTLGGSYDREEILHFFHMLTAHYFAFPKTQLAMQPDTTLAPGEARQLQNALEQLGSATPIQYVIGKTSFMDQELKVSPAVLIPRPETEGLVRWVLDHRGELPPVPRVLDLGTGSGCIALGLKKHLPRAEVHALDVSGPALEVAGENARALGLEIHFHQADIHAPGGDWGSFDLLISNPPYVPESDRAGMQRHVAEAEPALALFVPDVAPLCHYESIARFARGHLQPGGMLFLEVYAALATEVCQLLEGCGFEGIALKKDIFGRDRFIRAGLSISGKGPKADTSQKKFRK